MFMEKANPALRRVEKRNYRMDETQCLRMIRASLAPSTGCTEPAAIALNAATARKAAQGTVTQVTARLDAYLFKNAMGVGIPGADERGVDLCVALGITAGDADAGMNALHTVTAEQLAAAKELGAKLDDSSVTLTIKAGEGGRAFGSVSSKEIAKAIGDQLGIDIDKKKIMLSDPIKSIGSFEVPVKLHKDVTARLAVKVVEA